MESNGAAHPLFTVVLISYRHDNYCGEALESILNQDINRDLFEIIAVAKSTGAATEMLKEKSRTVPIRILTHDGFPQGTKLKLAIDAAKGSWISILEDDDLWHPLKLSRVLKLISSCEDDIVYVHDKPRPFVGDDAPDPDPVLRETDSNSCFVFDCQSFWKTPRINLCDHNASSVTIKRELFTEEMGMLQNLEGGLDTFLFAVALASGRKLARTRELLAFFRISKEVPSRSYTIGNLKRQLQGFRLIRERMGKYPVPGLDSILDYRMNTNLMKLALLGNSEETAESPITLVRSILSNPLSRSIENITLVLLFLIRSMNTGLSEKVYFLASSLEAKRRRSI